MPLLQPIEFLAWGFCLDGYYVVFGTLPPWALCGFDSRVLCSFYFKVDLGSDDFTFAAYVNLVHYLEIQVYDFSCAVIDVYVRHEHCVGFKMKRV